VWCYPRGARGDDARASRDSERWRIANGTNAGAVKGPAFINDGDGFAATLNGSDRRGAGWRRRMYLFGEGIAARARQRDCDSGQLAHDAGNVGTTAEKERERFAATRVGTDSERTGADPGINRGDHAAAVSPKRTSRSDKDVGGKL